MPCSHHAGSSGHANPNFDNRRAGESTSNEAQPSFHSGYATVRAVSGRVVNFDRPNTTNSQDDGYNPGPRISHPNTTNSQEHGYNPGRISSRWLLFHTHPDPSTSINKLTNHIEDLEHQLDKCDAHRRQITSLNRQLHAYRCNPGLPLERCAAHRAHLTNCNQRLHAVYQEQREDIGMLNETREELDEERRRNGSLERENAELRRQMELLWSENRSLEERIGSYRRRMDGFGTPEPVAVGYGFMG
ncbi:hypothetical protein BJ508DRAFT_411813 [Ascobolus immersus RN42]|uniref:Uncharacterized protein n=1 Tax=Ascobolus immersus RN42 TaxID=1160509 RepID=A0A3N4IMB3_ASCIM|nr:hypothetical protein BJ508DRAFT_411813 [Ascobolus immersus RN42]